LNLPTVPDIRKSKWRVPMKDITERDDDALPKATPTFSTTLDLNS
jgi:hypothetical protein